MKTWMVGGLLGVIALGVYFVAGDNDTLRPTPIVEVAAVPAADIAITPVVLADVVNVTNIDALLDPPTIPVADSDAPLAPVVVSVSADHVPAARPALPGTIPAAAD